MANCHQDRCIDVHWPAWSEKDTLKLTTYIMKLYERYNSYAMGICRPVMYPLLDNHKSEHSTLILSNRWKLLSRDSLQFWDFWTVFKEPVCGELNFDHHYLPVKLSAYCKGAFDMKEGEIFTVNTQYELDDCNAYVWVPWWLQLDS